MTSIVHDDADAAAANSSEMFHNYIDNLSAEVRRIVGEQLSRKYPVLTQLVNQRIPWQAMSVSVSQRVQRVLSTRFGTTDHLQLIAA